MISYKQQLGRVMRDGKPIGVVTGVQFTSYKQDDACNPFANTSQGKLDLAKPDVDQGKAQFAAIVGDVGNGRPVGHWIAQPRKWKRKQRKDKQAALNWGNHLAHDPKDVWMPRASKGWRRHVRKVKANG
jgi:hypothetical protein